jgi:hypothetical protein
MRIPFVTIIIFTLLCGCASSKASLITFATESGAIQYFFPMTEWEGAKKAGVDAVCDITCRYEEGAVGIYNISFTYTGKNTGPAAPPLPSDLYLTGDGNRYPLRDVDLLFSNAEKRTTRITSAIDGVDLLAVLHSASITLGAVIDGTEYQYAPSDRFLTYRDKVLADIAARNTLNAGN